MTPRWKNRPEGSNWGDFGPDDQIGRLVPTHVTQHHLGRQNQRTWIDFILAGIFWCRTVGRLKQSDGIAQISTGGDADTTDLGGERI